MDLGIIAAVLMLIVWGVITFVVNDAPGITHALLTAGVAVLVWRVAKKGNEVQGNGKGETTRDERKRKGN